MLELHVIASTYRSMNQFQGPKFAVGLRPLLVFSGTPFESPVDNAYTLAKSLLTDLFRGDTRSSQVDVAGLQYIVSVTAEEEGAAGADSTNGASTTALPAIASRRTVRDCPRWCRARAA